LSASIRHFGALIAHDSVALVEYDAERMGLRVIDQWVDATRSASIDQAIDRLRALLESVDARMASIALAVEQFGVFQHSMTLPAATDEVLRPIVRREVQRVFGVADPVIAFTRGAIDERREPSRADARTAPHQILVAGAPQETINALRDRLADKTVNVECVTVVPKAMHSLYDATGGALEPTAVLVCLESGPHLAFFLEGRLEMAIDPPIALEGDRPSVEMILDQVERGAVYFRQQFRGATASRVLLAASPKDYEELASALQSRLGAHVKPLFSGVTAPEAVIAMGAVLEARQAAPLDLFPHPPTVAERVRNLMRGPNAAVAASVAAAALAILFAGRQVTSLHGDRAATERLRNSLKATIPTVEPMRQIAERRSDFAKQVEYVRSVQGERSALAQSLVAIASTTPDAIRFDSLHVTRSATGWNVIVAGAAKGASGAQAVRSLDGFFTSLRMRDGVSDANLDRLDYPATNDTTHKAPTAVVIQFRASFALARPSGASH